MNNKKKKISGSLSVQGRRNYDDGISAAGADSEQSEDFQDLNDI